MTAPTLPARAEEDARLRPVSWRRMAWVTWRQHRTVLAGVAVPLGVLAVYLWLAGLALHHAWIAVAACHPASSLACQEAISNFNDTYGSRAQAAEFLLQAVPALIGAFVGAPVLARELETGTFRYTWTQGFGRWRWTLAKLVPLAIAVAVAAGALSVLFSWYVQPLFADGNQTPLAPIVFDLRGVAFAAWTLASFAIGALAGMLIRRVVPAIAAALAAYVGFALAVGVFLRQHYAAPLVTSNLNVPSSGWIMSQWWTKGGRFVFAGRPPVGLAMQICPLPTAGFSKPSPGTIWQCFVQHGYTQWTSYQPAGRFWPFQWIEGGWLLALSVLLIAVAVWLVRRRAS
ncbi:ABC transporter permease subunit [Rugosimonospora africana]|uniref:Transporter n=1 Tax=Rugosimonospora africana TaxID=556532 RepID=A0A8J3QX19_9ACTN|nr:ABC transporter permease subunit [Rugosimonospora africana]GIH18990.1 transporter [Rugosimonospora africana]